LKEEIRLKGQAEIGPSPLEETLELLVKDMK